MSRNGQGNGNVLYYGNNLDVLRRHVKDESVDLVYLDPPFQSGRNYNVLFQERDGSRSAAQIRAFEDTWRWDRSAQESYEAVVEAGGRSSRALQGLRTFLGESDMMAYLCMMAPRLEELRRVLKDTGSIWLHCDPTASHYLKVLMDAVFGPRRMVNEVVWHHGLGAFSTRGAFPSKHDILLYYAKGPRQTHNELRGEVTPQMEAKYCHREGDRRYMMSYGKKYYLKGGKPYDDVWDIPAMSPTAKERLGYPTQKPEALLERVILAGSLPGATVMDPFAGCGTTIAVAQRLGRRWIGVDVTHLAIALVRHRLGDAFGGAAKYRVVGEPEDLAGAAQLAKDDPWQFQWWALGLVDARPADGRKGPDRGIDGRLYFHDEAGGQTKSVVISVKAGRTGVAHVRDLRGVVEREEAAIGVLVCMAEPTSEMRKEAAAAGSYLSPGWRKKYPRLQILSIADLLAGKRVERPPHSETFRIAPKAKGAPEPLLEGLA